MRWAALIAVPLNVASVRFLKGGTRHSFPRWQEAGGVAILLLTYSGGQGTACCSSDYMLLIVIADRDSFFLAPGSDSHLNPSKTEWATRAHAQGTVHV